MSSIQRIPWLCEPCFERHTDGEGCQRSDSRDPRFRGHRVAPDPGLALCTDRDCPTAGKLSHIVAVCLPPTAMVAIQGPAPRPASKWEVPLLVVVAVFYVAMLWVMITRVWFRSWFQ